MITKEEEAVGYNSLFFMITQGQPHQKQDALFLMFERTMDGLTKVRLTKVHYFNRQESKT